VRCGIGRLASAGIRVSLPAVRCLRRTRASRPCRSRPALAPAAAIGLRRVQRSAAGAPGAGRALSAICANDWCKWATRVLRPERPVSPGAGPACVPAPLRVQPPGTLRSRPLRAARP